MYTVELKSLKAHKNLSDFHINLGIIRKFEDLEKKFKNTSFNMYKEEKIFSVLLCF